MHLFWKRKRGAAEGAAASTTFSSMPHQAAGGAAPAAAPSADHATEDAPRGSKPRHASDAARRVASGAGAPVGLWDSLATLPDVTPTLRSEVGEDRNAELVPATSHDNVLSTPTETARQPAAPPAPERHRSVTDAPPLHAQGGQPGGAVQAGVAGSRVPDADVADGEQANHTVTPTGDTAVVASSPTRTSRRPPRQRESGQQSEVPPLAGTSNHRVGSDGAALASAPKDSKRANEAAPPPLPGRPLKRNELPTPDVSLAVITYQGMHDRPAMLPDSYMCIAEQFCGDMRYLLLVRRTGATSSTSAASDDVARQTRLVVPSDRVQVLPANEEGVVSPSPTRRRVRDTRADPRSTAGSGKRRSNKAS